MRRLGLPVYEFLIFGVLMDILTTIIAIRLGGVEDNPIAASQMTIGVWPYMDIVFIMALIVLSELMLRTRLPCKEAFLAAPFLAGCVRFWIGCHNVVVVLLLLSPFWRKVGWWMKRQGNRYSTWRTQSSIMTA